ncbi:uncharacterized protein N7511_007456 [Penicillium nucicola]|uniref:uncharacterized protein n=1 Tax=Penicillium nucicola TaxID=1850975 RepID=UPI002544EAEE|nr:uncharacterized protein N7511_007456 [Penicillium nucicola]KAJ5757274.1 hypothetical protein N7511_007456 [Penicillium nucicola]
MVAAGGSEEPELVYSAFGKYERMFIITMVTLAGLASPLSSQIYYPAVPILADYYGVTVGKINLTITTYMIVQGLAPAFLSSFADSGGRRPAYILAFITYFMANLGLALQDNYAALLALRCLQSAGSSATFSLGYGVAADIAASRQRGRYMGSMNAGFMTALAFGPFLGGILVQWQGWRSIFWFLVIASGSYMVLYLVAVPETSRQLVGNGTFCPSSPLRMSGIQCLQAWCKRASSVDPNVLRRQDNSTNPRLQTYNPIRALEVFRSKSAAIVICHLGLNYTFNIMMGTSTANLFGRLYNLDSMKVGLCFLPAGICGCIGSLLTGIIADRNYQRFSHRLGYTSDNQVRTGPQKFPFEKARLQIVFPLTAVVITCLLLYGWMLQRRVPLAVLLVLQGIQGFCSTGSISVLSTLLTDLNPTRPATASAASNMVRCWLGAGAVAALDHMFNGMGFGWCFSFMGLLLLASVPLLCLVYVYGLEWRTAS